MAITLRTGRPGDGSTVLIHMGAGASETVVRQTIASYQDYRRLAAALGKAPYGLFSVSVYGLINGVTREEIFQVMPQAQFGEALYADVRRTFPDILATTIEDPEYPPELVAVQRGHFDVVLPHPDMPLLATTDPRDLVRKMRAPLERHLRSVLESDLLPLFQPRGRKGS